MTAARWYVVKTKARQEQVAEDNLRRQGYEAWLPTVSCERRRRGKWLPNTEPLFPGYLFVELEPGVQSFSPIRSTRGVNDLVRVAREPAAMPHGSVESLRYQHSNDDPETPIFKEGEKVRLVDGPFCGWEGVFSAAAGLERVVVLLEILGKQQSLAFARDNVVPA